MSTEIRLNRHGLPFGSIQATKLGASHLLKKEGLESTPVVVDGGFGLEVELPEGVEPKKPDRPDRIRIGARDVLTIPLRHGFKRRCVNIDEKKAGWARVERFQEAGYKIIEGDVPIGNERIAAASQMGKAVIRPVGDGVQGIWMEIEEDWYLEDQAEKLAKIDEKEQGLTINETNPGEGMYGEVSIT